MCDKLGYSDHHALNLGITVRQPVQPVVGERVVYLKNRVDWNLVRRDVMNIQWNAIVDACEKKEINNYI